MNFIITATQIVILLASAIWTRNYLGDVHLAAINSDLSITLFYSVTGCISSILLAISVYLLLLSSTRGHNDYT